MTTSLNPNAEVFHSSQPATSSAAIDATSTHWSDPLAPDLAVTNISTGSSVITVNSGIDLRPGLVQMSVIYPPTPLCSPASDYQTTSLTQLDISPRSSVLFLTDADHQEVAAGKEGQLDKCLPTDQLRVMLKNQLEYYFSQENLAVDAYLVSQMDSDQFVSIATVASFDHIKQLTTDMQLIVEVLKESPYVQVDELGKKVRPVHKRCIVILREIPESTPLEEVENLFSGESCPKFVSCEFAHNNSWYVTFDTEEDAQKAYCYLREEVRTFRGMPIMARIKAKPMLRSTGSFMAKESLKSQYELTGFVSPKYTYTSSVPSIQYITPQSLPFCPQSSTIAPLWSNSFSYCDPGMAFAANGYVPTLTFTPLHSQTALLNSSHRGHRLNVGDSSTGHYSHAGRSFTMGHTGNRTAGDETALLDQTSRRVPRFNSARTVPPPADCFRGTGPRMSQPRWNAGGRFGSTPRYSCSSDAAHQSSAAGISAAELQSKRCPEQVGTSQSASTAREHGLSSRGFGGYRSRRKNRSGVGDGSKNPSSNAKDRDGSQANSSSVVFEFEEKYFPPLPGSVKVPASVDVFDSKISDIVCGKHRTRTVSDDTPPLCSSTSVSMSSPVKTTQHSQHSVSGKKITVTVASTASLSSPVPNMETGDTSVTRPSYAQMAVRGKERLRETNGEMLSSGDLSVPEVCSEAGGEVLHEKQAVRGRMLDKCKKSSPRHGITSRRLSGDCVAKENHCVQSTVCQTERHGTV